MPSPSRPSLPLPPGARTGDTVKFGRLAVTLPPTAAERLAVRADPPTAKAPTKRGGMNGTEREWAACLDARKADGEIVEWRYEAMSLPVTGQFDSSHKRVMYMGDFVVLTAEGEIQVHEVKGSFAREKDLLRLKCEADSWRPYFAFVLAVKRRKVDGGGWSVERL